MGPTMMMMPGPGAIWLPVTVVLLLVLLVAGGVAAAVLAGRHRRAPQLPPPPPDPVETLKQRYAAGEIDHDELDRRLDVLLRR